MKLEELEKYRNDFLLFAYFGALYNERSDATSKSSALTVCIERAYRDINRTLGFTYTTEELKKKNSSDKKEFDKLKVNFKQGAGERLQKRVDLIIRADIKAGNDNFDKWHKDACTELVELAKSWPEGKLKLFKDKGFTYGHAQKWVNMTLKNMLIMGLWDNELLKYVNCLHIPIDSYILSAAGKSKTEKIHEDCSVNGLDVKDNLGKWSKIDNYDAYKNYQEQIRESLQSLKMSPIKWEGLAWIAQAENIKNHQG